LSDLAYEMYVYTLLHLYVIGVYTQLRRLNSFTWVSEDLSENASFRKLSETLSN